MKKIVFTVAILLVAGNANSAEWVSKWFDGPAPANYENVTGGVTRTYVNMPAQGGHVEWTLNTSAPTKTGGSFFPVLLPGQMLLQLLAFRYLMAMLPVALQ